MNTGNTFNRSGARAAIALALILVACVPSSFAQEIFSDAEIKSIHRDSRAPKGACASFEAEIAGSMRQQPTATLDVDNLFSVAGVISVIMDVIQSGPGKVRMAVSDEATCEALKKAEGSMSVTLQGARDTEDRPVLPNATTFSIQN